MGKLIDADALKKNCKCTGTFESNFQCVSLKTLGEVIDAQPTAYNLNEVIANLEEYFEENELEENSGFIEVCIDIVKDGVTDQDTEYREKARLDKILEQLQKVSYERFGNDGMGGELVVNMDDAIEIVRGAANEY